MRPRIPRLVSAIMPIASPSRLNLARTTINNFLRQYYRPIELIVVNAAGKPVLTKEEDLSADGVSVTELLVEDKGNPSALRNIGIKQAVGDWILPVDDDDWFHQMRLMYQLSHRQGMNPCLLKYQLLLDVSEILRQPSDEKTPAKLKMRLHSSGSGVPSTILFPRVKGKDGLWLYDDKLNVGEHEELLSRMVVSGLETIVCDNCHYSSDDSVSWPMLSVAVYHTINELPRFRFFHGKDPVKVKPEELTAGDISLLKRVLLSYNFSVV